MGVITDPRKEWRCRDCGAAIVVDTVLDRIEAARAQDPPPDFRGMIENGDDLELVWLASVPGACAACGGGRVKMTISMRDALRAAIGHQRHRG